MLRRERMTDFRRGAEGCLRAGRTYPVDERILRVGRANRAAERSARLAQRMKPGIRRLAELLRRVARHGLAQYLRVQHSERPPERK
jgi:hypothetical protein